MGIKILLFADESGFKEILQCQGQLCSTRALTKYCIEIVLEDFRK